MLPVVQTDVMTKQLRGVRRNVDDPVLLAG
jgi:hypothetical protein